MHLISFHNRAHNPVTERLQNPAFPIDVGRCRELIDFEHLHDVGCTQLGVKRLPARLDSSDALRKGAEAVKNGRCRNASELSVKTLTEVRRKKTDDSRKSRTCTS